ncbi:MAG TPA: peptide-binding protein [Phycisphaerae bacterium]|nr:peptide-binding protein [Phycisphaerae bacterium]
MGNRFTIKDFIFTLLLIAVISVIALLWGQFKYLNQQITGINQQLQTVNDQQIQQSTLLNKIITGGPTPATTMPAQTQNIRETLPDGSQYVYYPNPPTIPNNPSTQPDYAEGDWLVGNFPAEPTTLTPYVVKDLYGAIAQQWVLESLVNIDPNTLEFIPWLAESYRISADGLTITYKLRKNACFSDGSPVTAQDVVFSFNTIMNPDVDCAQVRGYFEFVKSCTAVGTDTVIFKFTQPYFLSLYETGGMQIIPEKYYQFIKGSDFNNRGTLLVGSGPYKLDQWTAGQQMVFVRNPHYWGPRPAFDRIVYRFILNPQAELQSYLNGEIDAIDITPGVDPEIWNKYTADPDFVKNNLFYKFFSLDTGFWFIGWNELKPEFTDRQTRTALAMLVDRDSIVKTFLHGLGTHITGPFSPISPQNDPGIKPIPYNPAEARKLLAQAGWRLGPDGVLQRNGTEFRFQLQMHTDNQLYADIASYIKQQLATAGIEMDLEPLEFSVMIQNMDQRKFDAIMLGWSGMIENDPYQLFDSASIPNQGNNFVSYSDPEADRLMEQARTELNDAKRMALWHQLQAVLYRDQPYMFLYTEQATAFINPRFHDTQPFLKLGLGQPAWPPGYAWYVPMGQQKYR